jgi:hypothetical protein
MAQLQKGHTYNPGDIVDAADLEQSAGRCHGHQWTYRRSTNGRSDTAADSLLFTIFQRHRPVKKARFRQSVTMVTDFTAGLTGVFTTVLLLATTQV